MAAIVRAALLTVLFSLYAGAQSRSLALYMGPAKGLHAEAMAAAQHELQRLLTPASIDVSWKNLQTRKSGEQFDNVIVMSVDGLCSDPILPPSPLPQDASITLADSAISEGRLLPFIRVNCEYIAQMLAAELRPLDVTKRDAIFGRALGRVVAHEIYHIMGETTGHQAHGVAKAAFSVRDLIDGEFEFDHTSLAQMRPTPSFSASTSSEEFLER
jgi:hypothetical protein